MSIGQEMVDAIRENLGWELAKTLKEVKFNTPNVLDCNETFCIVTCMEEDRPYIEAMCEMVDSGDNDIKIVTKEKAGRTKAGTGFGDRVWRWNRQHDGVEISFGGKPDDETRNTLKSLGFRWSHASGVWYKSGKKLTEGDKQYLLQFGKVDDLT